jgi:hypothetical protein
VSPSDFATDIKGSEAEVQTDLLIDVPEEDGDPSRAKQVWKFQLRDEDGWRVCGAARQGS